MKLKKHEDVNMSKPYYQYINYEYKIGLLP